MRFAVNKLRVLVASIALAASVVMAGATSAGAGMIWPAHSSYTHNYRYSYSEMRSGPNYSWSYVTAALYNDTTVYMRCWVDSQWWNGPNYGSNRWFYVTTSSGRTGWVHSSYVWRQASVPRC